MKKYTLTFALVLFILPLFTHAQVVNVKVDVINDGAGTLSASDFYYNVGHGGTDGINTGRDWSKAIWGTADFKANKIEENSDPKPIIWPVTYSIFTTSSGTRIYGIMNTKEQERKIETYWKENGGSITFSEECNGIIEIGQTKNCTITVNDSQIDVGQLNIQYTFIGSYSLPVNYTIIQKLSNGAQQTQGGTSIGNPGYILDIPFDSLEPNVQEYHVIFQPASPFILQMSGDCEGQVPIAGETKTCLATFRLPPPPVQAPAPTSTQSPPTCTSWTYSDWGACVNDQQTRTITSPQPANCAGGNPILSQSCNSTPFCTENNWTSTLTPTNCPNNGQQTKNWTKVGQCQGGVSHSGEEIISCNYQAPTCTSFVYSDWGICNTSGAQSRSVLSSSSSDCIGGNPVLSQNCKYNNSGEILNKDSVVETKDNLSVSTKNQNSRNVKEPQVNQIQNESNQNKNNEQKVNQEKNITGSEVAEQRRSEVASAVQEILQVAERDSGVGQQVKIIAQTQVQNQEKLEASLQKVQSRSGLAKFFVGPNYDEINNAKKSLEQNREQIKQLSEIKDQLANRNDQQKLTDQIKLFEQSNQEIENSLNTSQKGFSLFGWLFRLFTK